MVLKHQIYLLFKVYYEVLSAKAKDSEQAIDVIMNFSNNTFSTRLWEIKVSQIPFSQRAPAGCLQYFTGTNGIIQVMLCYVNGIGKMGKWEI